MLQSVERSETQLLRKLQAQLLPNMPEGAHLIELRAIVAPRFSYQALAQTCASPFNELCLLRVCVCCIWRFAPIAIASHSAAWAEQFLPASLSKTPQRIATVSAI